MNKKYIVYQIENTVTNEKYIGLTSQSLNLRLKNGKGYKEKTKIRQSIEKYGWDNFEHKILFETTNKELAEEKEKYYIALFKTIEKGYNKQSGGYKQTGYFITEEQCKNMSISHLGQHSSPKTEFKKGICYGKQIAVKCIELNKIFENYKKAEQELGISHHIYDVLKGYRKTCGGYHWEVAQCQEK